MPSSSAQSQCRCGSVYELAPRLHNSYQKASTNRWSGIWCKPPPVRSDSSSSNVSSSIGPTSDRSARSSNEATTSIGQRGVDHGAPHRFHIRQMNSHQPIPAIHTSFTTSPQSARASRRSPPMHSYLHTFLQLEGIERQCVKVEALHSGHRQSSARATDPPSLYLINVTGPDTRM